MFFNTILLALLAIRRNVMRSVLTVLGIIIGVGAVITLVTIGNGSTAQVAAQIASMGTNLLMVFPGQRHSTSTALFTLQDVQAIQKEISPLNAVAPVSNENATAVVGNRNWSTSINGSTNDFFIARNWTLASGRVFEPVELLSGRAVCVIGSTVRENLFPREDPVGQKIRLGKVSCQVIGLLQEKGQSSMGRDQDDLIVMPLLTVQRRFSGNRDVGTIHLSVAESGSSEQVTEDLTALLRKRRHLAASEEDDFRIRDTKELAAMLTGTTKTMTSLLGAVAAVSLLVGGIGIMNIMLVSVTERTREIGIRLAIGAFEHEVLLQFLTEAVVLSSIGGLIGIIIALAASFWITQAMGIPFIPDFQIIIIAFLFSAAVGVVFGYFPALKAARLDPIDALRHE
jgi:putative ABC transport system permease protein